MRRTLFMALIVAMMGSFAYAQGKVTTKWHCMKASAEHKLPVGDKADHNYVVAQGSCTATSSDPSHAEKSGTLTEFREEWKDKISGHGRFNSTLDNGDMVYYTYEFSGPMDPKKPMSDKWKIVGGTGKSAGLTGSGVCKGMFQQDQSSDWECTGTATAAPAKAAPAKMAPKKM